MLKKPEVHKKLRVPQFSADLTNHKYKFDIQIEQGNTTVAQPDKPDTSGPINKGKEVQVKALHGYLKQVFERYNANVTCVLLLCQLPDSSMNDGSKRHSVLTKHCIHLGACAMPRLVNKAMVRTSTRPLIILTPPP